MKNLLKKLVIKTLEKAEQTLMASVAIYEMGLSPIEVNYFMPIVYTGIWETQYFNSLAQTKLAETAERPSSI